MKVSIHMLYFNFKNWESNYKFVGFENISVMGKTQKAAHISYTEQSDSYLICFEKWYVKGLGLVLAESTTKNGTGSSSQTIEMISTTADMTDIQAYQDFLDFYYGYKSIAAGQLYSLLADIDHDGEKEMIIFEYEGELPVDVSAPNRYSWKVYKYINGQVQMIYQDVSIMQRHDGSRGEGVEYLNLEGQDYLFFWYDYRSTSGTYSVKYIKNNKLHTKMELEIEAPYYYLDNSIEIENEPGYEINEDYFDAFINGKPCSIQEARRISQQYMEMAKPLSEDYLGKKWTD